MKNKVYTVKEGVAPINFEDGLALLNQASGEYFVINEVGREIWSKLDGSNTLGDITHMIASEYEVSQEECENSVINFIKQLIKDKLIEG